MYLLLSSYILDLVFGDPEWMIHPVRGIGRLVNRLEMFLKGEGAIWAERLKGGILSVSVIAVSSLTVYLLLRICSEINIVLYHLVWIYIAYSTIAVKDLRVKAKGVLNALENNNLNKARCELSNIVGRDTENLSQEKIVKAAVESIAESTNDGIIAPLFYLILGGPVTAVAYKAISTLDSTIGYKNERYIYFGWFAARLDDTVNFIPARISGFLISVSSFVLRNGFIDSLKIMRRDGNKHPSPNSGIPEAAMAGALGIRLGGPSMYQGELEYKPYIGEDKADAEPQLINEALTISFISSLLMVSTGVLIRWVI